ncbi:MAG: alkaline phosphatase, partial [Pseudomonadota bacterium]
MLLRSILLCTSVCAAALASSAQAELKVNLLGTYETKVFDEGAAEIVAHDAKNQRLFIVNGNDKTIDVIDFKDPKAMTKINAIDLSEYGKTANSVAVHGERVAVAVEANDKQAN